MIKRTAGNGLKLMESLKDIDNAAHISHEWLYQYFNPK